MKHRFNLRPPVVRAEEEAAHSHDVESPSSVELPTKETSLVTESDVKDKDEIVTPGFQHGVQGAQAVNQMWTRKQLILAYVLIWIINFFQAFSSGVIGTLTPHVTSSFEAHSLTAVMSIVSGLIGGLVKLPYAKLIDIWGRPQGFALMVTSLVVGIIMMAGCNDVKTYCAAQVFYTVGYLGIDFSMTIFIADTSHLKDRAFMLAFIASPWLVSTWVYGPATESILNTIGFRWGFGILAIIIPIVCAPLFALFYFIHKKAIKAGVLPRHKSNRTFAQSFIYYCREFDVIGLLIICTGLSLFLLSFSLYSYQVAGWGSPLIICFMIFGGLLTIAFALYERFLAPVCFIPWKLFTDRTVFCTYIMAASIYVGWYIWDSYFYSFVIVVFNLSVTQASYIGNIYTMGACFWSFIVGIIVHYNGRLKWQALFFGAPLTILGVGLMIKFRQPDTPIGYIVMCQIFVALGGGTLVICEQMTVMAVSSQQHIPAALALESMIISIGGSIGSTIAAAMWTGIFPMKLAQHLPADAQGALADIYGSLGVQSSYEVGTPTRDAINRSYGDTQRLMLITATCVYAITIVSIIPWRDINVKNMKEVKGLAI